MLSYVPAIRNRRVRTLTGLLIATFSVVFAESRTGGNELIAVLGLFVTVWIVGLVLTDKYKHKYSYRYYSYLLASHAKAAVIMATLLGFTLWFVSPYQSLADVVWESFGWFLLIDLLVSVPRIRRPGPRDYDQAVLVSREVSAQVDPVHDADSGKIEAPKRVNNQQAFADVATSLDDALLTFVKDTIPEFHEGLTTTIVQDRHLYTRKLKVDQLAQLVITSVRINDARRINRFLVACCNRLEMGGHFICYYESLEKSREAIMRKFGRLFWPAFLLHFAWHRAWPKIPVLNRLYFMLTQGKNRNLSKAEVWGRLSFCGLKVLSEHEIGPLRFVTAQRIALPLINKKPSYYPIVGLSKVGLDGAIIKTHKVRSMYPFSEFLQQQLFEGEGLATTGKFKNDFRLTEYGKFLRRYWLDELPQIYDWLRGDIKLVGIRATSPHYLSLYPKDLIDLYVRVKPGLIPPLFDETTDSFDRIVKVELDYLNRYALAPFRTDISLLWDTFRDIVFRGVRSN